MGRGGRKEKTERVFGIRIYSGPVLSLYRNLGFEGKLRIGKIIEFYIFLNQL